MITLEDVQTKYRELEEAQQTFWDAVTKENQLLARDNLEKSQQEYKAICQQWQSQHTNVTGAPWADFIIYTSTLCGYNITDH